MRNGRGAGTTITFPSLDPSRPRHVSGTLYLPEGTPRPCPAIVLVHGTAGIDSRGAICRGPLLGAGIAVCEVDFKTGVFTSVLDRPPNDTFLPLAFAALKALRGLPAIDPRRIGVMGFSLGGGVALRTALEANRQAWMGAEQGFAAHVAFYPNCPPFIRQLEASLGRMTGAAVIIFYGTEDCFGAGEAVPELKRLLADKFDFEVTTVEYPGATHGFNRNEPTVTLPDPTAIGGTCVMSWDPEATKDSVSRVLAFLRENLAAT
jgi:dienelactone hydrolase